MVGLRNRRKLAKVYLGTLAGGLLVLIFWLTFVSPVAAILIGGSILFVAIIAGIAWATDAIWGSGPIDISEYEDN